MTEHLEIPREYFSPASCRATRDLLKISQAELAKDAEINVSTVRRYEAGTLPLSAYAARQIITALKKHKIVFVGASRNCAEGRTAEERPSAGFTARA